MHFQNVWLYIFQVTRDPNKSWVGGGGNVVVAVAEKSLCKKFNQIITPDLKTFIVYSKLFYLTEYCINICSKKN